LDPGEVTEDDDADLAHVEVEREAERAVLELEQLVGHGRGEALDVRDAVTGVGDDADLLGAGRAGRVVGHELLQRVPNLIGTNRELRHGVPALLGIRETWSACEAPAGGLEAT